MATVLNPSTGVKTQREMPDKSGYGYGADESADVGYGLPYLRSTMQAPSANATNPATTNEGTPGVDVEMNVNAPAPEPLPNS